MTLIVSMTHPDGIVMASDSYFVESTQSKTGTGEYASTRIVRTEVQKTYEIKGVGCLSFWGNWPVGDPRPLLTGFIQEAEEAAWDVEGASFRLQEYLKERICPNDDLGFHLGGFSGDEKRRLYHVFYGTRWDELGKSPDFHRNEEDVGAEEERYRILYNGEPKVTADAIRLLRRYEEELRIPVFPTTHPIEKAVEFAAFLIQYTHDEMAQKCGIPTVGGRVNIAVIRYDNSVKWEKRDPEPVGKPGRDWPVQGETGATVSDRGQ